MFQLCPRVYEQDFRYICSGFFLFSASPARAQSLFVRGDINADGSRDVSDAVAGLVHLFVDASQVSCLDAADADDTGSLDIAAPLTFLFSIFGNVVMALPGPTCGLDPTADTLDCQAHEPCTADPPVSRNILLVIVDDVGVDESSCYDSSGALASTPTIDSLCAAGVVFTNAWTNPVCAPTRAGLLTGRYSFRTGVGDVPGMGSPGIDLGEFTLSMALDRENSGYEHACMGKWHLSTNANGGVNNPNFMGFSRYAGWTGGGVPSFFDWTKVVDGDSSPVTNYATSENVDDALDWIDMRGDTPWFLWLAFNAPHTPFHLPPEELHTLEGLTGTEEHIAANPLLYYRAALEAVDSEVGRLLSSLPVEVRARTDVIFFGDNGTPPQTYASDDPGRRRVKGAPYEGGVRVPLVISGPSVIDGDRQVDALVNSTDLFATVLELAGVDIGGDLPDDSVSLVPYLEDSDQAALRSWIFAERFGPEVPDNRVFKAIRDERYKLIRLENLADEFYDLFDSPDESVNLLDDLLDAPLSGEAQQRFDDLTQLLDGLLAS